MKNSITISYIELFAITVLLFGVGIAITSPIVIDNYSILAEHEESVSLIFLGTVFIGVGIFVLWLSHSENSDRCILSYSEYNTLLRRVAFIEGREYSTFYGVGGFSKIPYKEFLTDNDNIISNTGIAKDIKKLSEAVQKLLSFNNE